MPFLTLLLACRVVSAATVPGAAPDAPISNSSGTEPEAPAAATSASPGFAPDSPYPQLVGAQYTFILQHQSALHSPYSGPNSLRPQGDTQPTNTIGFYTGWQPLSWAQLYLDTEKFDGEGVSDAVGVAGLTNGDVIRAGAAGIRKEFYIARLFTRFVLPLGSAAEEVARSEDHIPGTEPARRLELKVGRVAVPDDFDENRYADSPRTQFMNWSLMNDTAWDYAADTRGYTDGIVLAYVSPVWTVKYGVYRMPVHANQEQLVASLLTASGQNLQLTYAGLPTGTVLRFLTYLDTADMGNYAEALAIAARSHTIPDVDATAQQGRQKYGVGLNLEQPLADDGDTGVFARVGWDDGHQQAFAFTEVDDVVSAGAQVSGREWHEPDALLGVGLVSEGISASHRAYLAAGGCGFVLCDGALSYGREQIGEIYYRLERTWLPGPVHWQLGPDFQFVRNPGYNRARGPVSFWGLRLHAEY